MLYMGLLFSPNAGAATEATMTAKLIDRVRRIHRSPAAENSELMGRKNMIGNYKTIPACRYVYKTSEFVIP